MKVTVLMAVHDGERYVMQAIGSVLAQTFDDFELLIVDDASADATPQLLAAIEDPRVRVLRNETNLGQVPSLNRGLREARGEIVVRLDADDCCREDRLERQVAVLDSEPSVAVVGSWAKVVDADDHVIGFARQPLRDFVDFVYLNLIAWVQIPHPAAAYRRDVALELGGYDDALGPSEDKDLWRKMVLARHDARNVEAELIRYRVHGSQLSRVRAEQQQRHDAESHVGFLRKLAGDVDAGRLRLLLTADPGFFAGPDPAGGLRDLDALLAGAARRLRLSAGEQARLEALVRARVALTARRGAGRPASIRVAVYGLRRGGRGAVADALLFPVSPILRPVSSAARRVLRTTLASAPARAIEGPASRSPIARRIYSWLISRP